MRRIRSDVCRVFLFTSILWLLVDVIILFYFLDNSPISLEKRNLIRSAKFSNKLQSSSSTFNESSQHWPELKKILNELSFSLTGPGQYGAGVTIVKEKETEMKEMFKLNQFNLMASNMISINRTLPDYRSAKCKSNYKILKDSNLPSVSIIIVFHNEAFSTLLRTLHSVVNRSPHHLLAEIILVDDKSERDYLKEPLELYIKQFPISVRLIHLKERSGLIRARLTGSSISIGKILLFLDAHVEVSVGWLEPLISRVQADQKCVVAPIIDVISDDTFEYITASDTTWGGFNWQLNFRWYSVPNREMVRRNWDRSTPIHTPTIAGGLFAIDKNFFYNIGAYDEGMQVWGGENLEISFRVWTCGGSLEIHPCSRVGHVFRKQTPYTFPGGTATVIHHNAKRTAEVWMDDYKKFFYAMVPAARLVKAGNLSARQELRSALQCKSFKWYLENIYLEAPVPANYYSIGQILNVEAQYCIDTMGRKSGELVGLSVCHGIGGNQAWSLTAVGEIRSDEICLSGVGIGQGGIELSKCSTSPPLNQIFKFNPTNKQIVHKNSEGCLVVENNLLILATCDQNLRNGIWSVENYQELLSSSENLAGDAGQVHNDI